MFRPLRNMAGPLSLPFYQNPFPTTWLKKSTLTWFTRCASLSKGCWPISTPAGNPLVVSIWGNDHHPACQWLDIYGEHSPAGPCDEPMVSWRMLDAISVSGGEWGFASDKPTLVVPGAGGIRLDEMEAPSNSGILAGGTAGCPDHHQPTRPTTREFAAGCFFPGPSHW